MSSPDRIAPALEGLAAEIAASLDGTRRFEVAASKVRAAVQRLRDQCGFQANTFVTAIDRFPAEPRFEVVWQFLSVGAPGSRPVRVRLRTRVPSSDPRVPSIADLFPGATWSERECFDMFGVVFEGHEPLRRLLMPEGYGHHPLRKDFPHQGIEPDRLYREWDRRRHAMAESAPVPGGRGPQPSPEVPTGAPDVRTPP